MDYRTYLMIRQWAKRVKGTTGKGRSYFHRFGNNRWVFSIPQGPYLLAHWRYSSVVIKVRGDESVYNANALPTKYCEAIFCGQKYWKSRISHRPQLSTRAKMLLGIQKGICPYCGRNFYWDDVLEVDHIIELHKGGTDNFKNLQVLHKHCHHAKSAIARKKPIQKVLVNGIENRTGGHTSTESHSINYYLPGAVYIVNPRKFPRGA